MKFHKLLQLVRYMSNILLMQFVLSFVLPGDVPRVDGQLAVSRAFGDKSLKIHMRADPDIMIEDIDETTEFLVLASDGLWKVKLFTHYC